MRAQYKSPFIFCLGSISVVREDIKGSMKKRVVNVFLETKKKKTKKICYSNPQQQPSPLYQNSAILKITQICPIGVPAAEWRARYNTLSTHEKCESYLPFSTTVDRSY
jgi:hypothetical protein